MLYYYFIYIFADSIWIHAISLSGSPHSIICLYAFTIFIFLITWWLAVHVLTHISEWFTIFIENLI